MLRGEAALLRSQRMVPTYTGDQKYDPQSVHISLCLRRLARDSRRLSFTAIDPRDSIPIVFWDPALIIIDFKLEIARCTRPSNRVLLSYMPACNIRWWIICKRESYIHARETSQRDTNFICTGVIYIAMILYLFHSTRYVFTLITSVYIFLGTAMSLIDMMNSMQNQKLLENGEYMVIYVDMMTYSSREAQKYLWSE